jgi:hypothetical protein
MWVVRIAEDKEDRINNSPPDWDAPPADLPTTAEAPSGATMAGHPEGLQPIRPTTSHLTAANRWDHFLARWGVKRIGHRVEPGLYALGNPTPDASLFVTANYTLSFDALRSALKETDAYILVLDTQGINVWCAAGEGAFGTDELVHRIE